MIELAAHAWKLDLPLAVHKMLDLIGFPSPPPDVLARYCRAVERRRRADRFWKEAQTRADTHPSPELRALQRRFGGNDTGAAWAAYGGAIVGATHLEVVEAYFAPYIGRSRHAYRADGTRQDSGARHCFRPRSQWKDMLVVPFWELPGKLNGFLFIGRDGKPENGDFQYYWLRVNAENKEAGLAMLPAAMLPPHPILGTTLFAITDAFRAVHWQLSWMRSGDRPLPIVLPYESLEHGIHTERVWSWLPVEDVVFWAPTLTVDTIAQAVRAPQGLVSTLEVTPRELERYMRDRPILQWLQAIKAAALPWQTVFRDMLRNAAASRVEELILRAGLRGQALRDLIDGSDQALQERLSRLSLRQSFVRSAKVGCHTIYEKDDSWYDAKGALICNCIIHFEQLIKVQHSDRAFARGIIRFAGKTYPFFIPAGRSLDRGILDWAHDFLLDQGAGPLVYNPQWNRRIRSIAYQFHRPDLRISTDTIGWDPQDGGRFNFPTFSITSAGVVSDDFACLFYGQDVPCQNLGKPDTLPRKAIAGLSAYNEETQVFWATAACVLHNVIAPAMNAPTVGTVLDGEGAQALGRAAAKHLGCPLIEQTAGQSATGRIASQVLRHRWPCYVSLSAKAIATAAAKDWFTGQAASNTITPLPWATARVLGIRDTWCIIHCNRKLGSMQLVSTAAEYVVPAYLQDLCARRLDILRHGPSGINDLLHDLADWFARLRGDKGAVLAARQVLELPGLTSPVQHVMDLIARLIGDNVMPVVRDEIAPPHAARAAIGEVQIPQRAFSEAVERISGIPPDVLLVTKTLAAAGVLLGEVEIHDDRYWRLQETWWCKELDKRAISPQSPETA